MSAKQSTVSTPTLSAPPADWPDWLRRWDLQQTGYLPVREQRFDLMFTAVTTLRGEDCRILDLACGPGSVSQRFLNRFPRARSIGVDLDPVLLSLGQKVLGDMDGRLRLAAADLIDPQWMDVIGGERIDAVLTTTALHWLTADQLVRLYRQLAEILPAGGLVLNGDHMAYGVNQPTLNGLAETVKEQRHSIAFEENEDYAQWWSALEACSDSLPPQDRLPFEEKRRRFGDRGAERRRPGYDMHATALRDAGFAEVDVIWSNLDNRIVMAVR
jgi:SAM-dependent methyltransferase